jgi:hypothetical protein
MSVFSLFTRKAQEERGLYSPPEPNQSFPSHRAWAGRQRFGTDSIMAIAMAAVGPSIHHCRIGKITIKADAR